MSWKIPDCDELAPIPPKQICQETSIFTTDRLYIPCGAPAVSIVRHDKDNRSYYLCLMCADHNIRNRGGKLIRGIDPRTGETKE